MEEKKEKFSLSGSFKTLRQYIDSHLELIRLRAVASGSRIVGALVLGVVTGILMAMVFLFWCIALGFYLGEVLGSNALGFLATGSILLLIVILISLFKKRLSLWIMGTVIRKSLATWGVPDDGDKSYSENLKKAEEEAEKIKEELEEIEDEHK